MPYVRCPKCGLMSFSAVRWLNADRCNRCDTPLPRIRSAAAAAAPLLPSTREPRTGTAASGKRVR